MKKIDETGQGPGRAWWSFVYILIALSILGLYAVEKKWASVALAENIHLTFGILSAILILTLSAYRLRKMVYKRLIGSMNGWRQTHIYLGLLCALTVLVHTDFNVDGIFAIVITAIFTIVTISGIAGSILYKTIPVWLAKQGGSILEMDNQRKAPAEYLTEAERLAGKASSEFKEYYEENIKRRFTRISFIPIYWFRDEKDVGKGVKEIFEELYEGTPAQDRYTLKSLENLYLEREKTEFRWARRESLRWWLLVHVPANVALLAGLVAHVAAVLYY